MTRDASPGLPVSWRFSILTSHHNLCSTGAYIFLYFKAIQVHQTLLSMGCRGSLLAIWFPSNAMHRSISFEMRQEFA